MNAGHPGDSEQLAQTASADPLGSAPRVRTGRAIIFLIILAVAIAATGIFGRRHDDQLLARWTEEQAVPSVAVVSPKEGGAARELVLPGNVAAFHTAEIHGQVRGYVREWRADIGADVKKGEVLAIIDTPELDQSIAVAQSELAKAKADLAMAEVTAKRWDSLRASAAVSQQAADEKDSDGRVRAAEVATAQANLDRLKAQKAFANLVAPFDGVVTVRNIDVGSLVKADGSPGTPPLFSVSDVRQMRIYVPVPESYAGELRGGMKAWLELPEQPDRRFEATIETTSHAIDPKSRTLLVELLADNKDGALSPGAFTRVHFQISPDAGTVRVPASALLYRDNEQQVAVLGADGRVALRPVSIKRDLGAEVEISGGLSPSDRIVASPPDSIDDGEEVRLAETGSDNQGPRAAEGRRARSEPERVDEIAQTRRNRSE